MAGDTKERIVDVALGLFAQSGYLGTSMSDIAKQLGITKGALYKHYTGKQEILDSIVERMNQMDYERAEEYIRDFFADNPGKKLHDAIVCWNYKKSLPGCHRYEKSDLIALDRPIP